MARTDAKTLLWVTALALVGCADEYGSGPGDDPAFTEAQWKVIQELTPETFEARPDPSNKYADNDDARVFGQRLFFDDRLGNPETYPEGQGCFSCHLPEVAYTDAGMTEGMTKDVTSVINIAQYDYHTMIGKFDSLWSMPFAPTEGGFLDTDRLHIAMVIGQHYREAYECIFGDEHGESEQFFDNLSRFDAFATWDDFVGDASATEAEKSAISWIYANYGKSMAAYMRKIATGETKFDRYAGGDYDALSADEKEGLRLFIEDANCVACHNGPYFTDNEFHDIGLEPFDESRADALKLLQTEGTTPNEFRLNSIYSDDTSMYREDLPDSEDVAFEGAYRTPGLRNIAKTGPYMHDKSLETLQDVLWHYEMPVNYDGHIDDKLSSWQLDLDTEQERQLIAFLHSLSGDFEDKPLVDPMYAVSTPAWPVRCGL